MMRWILAWLFITSACAQPIYSKIIKLHYIQADVVLPVVQSLLKKGERISGAEQFIVLNASPDTLTAVRLVLQQMDVKPATFRISVYQGNPKGLTTKDKQYFTDLASQPVISSVKVVNGQTVQISMDKKVPVIDVLSYGFLTGIGYQSHSIRHSLFLRPESKGSSVQITLYKVNQQQSVQEQQTFEGQQINTTLLIPLNQWTSVSQAINDSSVTYSTNYSVLNNPLYIKVSKVH